MINSFYTYHKKTPFHILQYVYIHTYIHTCVCVCASFITQAALLPEVVDVVPRKGTEIDDAHAPLQLVQEREALLVRHRAAVWKAQSRNRNRNRGCDAARTRAQARRLVMKSSE